MADMVWRPRLADEDLKNEREIVIEEIAMYEDDPQDTVHDLLTAAIYPGQALGRPVIGTAEVIGSVPKDGIDAYHKHHYRAPNMVVSAAGNITHDELLELSERLMGGIGAGGEPAPFEAAAPGAPGTGIKEKPTEQVHLCIGGPGLSRSDPRRHAQSVLDTLLGGLMSSRLFQEVREKRGLVYSIYSFHAGFADSGLFGVYAGTGEKSLGELTPIVFDQLAGVARAVAPEELARAKAQLRADVLMSLESTGARAEQIARQLTIYGRILSPSEVTAEIDKVDNAALARCAAVLMKGPLTVTTLGPAKTLESFEKLSRRLAP